MFFRHMINNKVPVQELFDGLKRNDSNKLGIIFSDDDVGYHVEDFYNGKRTFLIITGLSGGGKTTLAKSIAEKTNSTLIEMDHFDHWDRYTTKSYNRSAKFFEGYSNELDEYMKETFYDAETFLKVKGNRVTRFNAHLDCIKYFLNKSSKDNKYIFEGVQAATCLLIDSSILKDCSLIIVNTSVLKSIYRRTSRDGLDRTLPDIISILKGYKSWYDDQNTLKVIASKNYYFNDLKFK